MRVYGRSGGRRNDVFREWSEGRSEQRGWSLRVIAQYVSNGNYFFRHNVIILTQYVFAMSIESVKKN